MSDQVNNVEQCAAGEPQVQPNDKIDCGCEALVVVSTVEQVGVSVEETGTEADDPSGAEVESEEDEAIYANFLARNQPNCEVDDDDENDPDWLPEDHQDSISSSEEESNNESNFSFDDLLADEVLENPKDAENAVDRAVSNNELNSGSDVLILVCVGQGNVSEGEADVGTEDSMEICGELDSLASDIEMEEENPESESEQESVRSPDGSSVYYSDEDEKVADVPEASVGAGQRPMAQQASPVQQSEQSGQPVRVSSSHSYNLRPRLSFVSYTSITKRARQEDSASSAPPAAKKRKTSKNGKKRANKRKMPTKVTSAAKRQRRC